MTLRDLEIYLKSVSTFLISCITQVLDLESTNTPTSRKRWNLWFLHDACLWNAAVNYGKSIESSALVGHLDLPQIKEITKSSVKLV